MQDVLTDFLQKRKNRCIGIILSVKERECDSELSALQSQKLRKVILDQLNDFYDTCVDVMGSLDTGEVVLNGQYLEKLSEIYDAVVLNGDHHGSDV